MGKPVVGILIHPWDIKDEGVRGVAETLSGLGISSAFIAVNAPRENHPPQPVDARLTHNPKRKRYVSEEGRFYYEVDPSFYTNSVVTPKRSSEGELMGFDALRETGEDFANAGIKSYAWITALHNGQFVSEAQELAVIDIMSHSDTNWLCPNNPNVIIQLLEIVNEIQTRYNLQGILLDNFWWKYPHTFMASLESGMVCFCDHCRQKMELIGIDPKELARTLAEIPKAVRNLSREKNKKIGSTEPKELLRIVGLPVSEGGGYADVMNVLFEDPEMRSRVPELAKEDPLKIFQWLNDNPIFFEWMDCKADGLYEMLKSVKTLVKGNDPDFELGLGIWSPRSSWTVMQRYGKLKYACDWMMPMVYHRLWGWYSTYVAEELFQIIHPRTPQVFASYKEILRSWFRLAGYTARPLRSIIFNGLPSGQIRKELVRARDLVGPDFPLYAGLQLWEPGSRIPHPEGAAEATNTCLEADVEGLIIQAYGWAPMPNLIAAGRSIEKSDRTRPSLDS